MVFVPLNKKGSKSLKVSVVDKIYVNYASVYRTLKSTSTCTSESVKEGLENLRMMTHEQAPVQAKSVALLELCSSDSASATARTRPGPAVVRAYRNS